MAGTASETKARILESAYALFYRNGFGRVGVDEIAETANVTKRTLYYHFDSKDSLIAAVLQHQHADSLDMMAGWMDGSDDNVVELIDRIFDALGNWTATPKWQGSGFTRAVVELSGLPGHPARAIASRHKAAIEQRVADKLKASGATDSRSLAKQILLLVEGALALTLIHGGQAYVQEARQAALTLATESHV